MEFGEIQAWLITDYLLSGKQLITASKRVNWQEYVISLALTLFWAHHKIRVTAQVSNEERKQPNDNVKALESALRDLGQQLIPRVQAFERTLRELVVAAKPYLINLAENVKALPAARLTSSES